MPYILMKSRNEGAVVASVVATHGDGNNEEGHDEGDGRILKTKQSDQLLLQHDRRCVHHVDKTS